MKRLFAGVAKVGTGVAAGQFIVVSTSPILSRLFDPSEFGTYSIIVSISAVLAVLFSGRLDLAVITAPSDRQARDAAVLGGLYLAMGAAVVSVVLVFAGAAYWRGEVQDVEYALVPALLLTAGLFEISSSYLVRRRLYGKAAWRSLILNGTLAGSQVGLGALNAAGGLSIGYLVSRIAGAAYSARAGGLRIGRDLRGLRLSGIAVVVKRTAHFPVVVAPASLLNALGTQAPVLLFGLLLGPAAAGLLGFTQRILSAPVSLLGQSLAQVYTAESASALRDSRDGARSLFLRTSILLAIAALCLGFSVYLLSPIVVEPLFGGEWVEAGPISQALSLGVAAQLVASPLSQTMNVYGRHRTQLVWDAFRLTAVVTVILVATALGATVTVTTWALSVASALSYAVLWILCLRAVVSKPQR